MPAWSEDGHCGPTGTRLGEPELAIKPAFDRLFPSLARLHRSPWAEGGEYTTKCGTEKKVESKFLPGYIAEPKPGTKRPKNR
jgi:hypothetical protein